MIVENSATSRYVATFCRICEPQCGLLAEVVDGRLVGVTGNSDHVHSRGFSCTKSVAAIDVAYDPDRVVRPLRRCDGPGDFEPVSWSEALDDIAARIKKIRLRHGSSSLATFMGNPPAFSVSAALGLAGFQDAVGVKWRYGVNAEDGAARTVANALLYGSCATLLLPDLWRTDFAVLLGTNPLVSHGSSVSEPLMRSALESVVARGGRVVVIDPRRTETARRFEHLPVRAGTDAHLLLGVVRTLIDEDLVDRGFITENTAGFRELVELVAQVELAACAEHCGLPETTLRGLARDLAAAPSALVFGRTGTCTQRFGTLNNILQDVVVALTGNTGRPGGLVFGWGAIDLASFSQRAGLDTFGAVRSRTTGLPDVNGMLPSTALASDILTPGEGQVRALLTVGANPVLSSAGGTELESALCELDLHVALDLYVNETNRTADYVLPVTSMFERDDVPLLALGTMLRPSVYATSAVIPPVGEAREEFEVLNELAQRLGAGGAYSHPALRTLARIGVRPRPMTMIDILLRTGPAGDWFGLRRGGVSVRKLLRQHPHGKALADATPIRDLAQLLATPDRRIQLCPPELESEVRRLQAESSNGDDTNFPLRLIGMRETRSQNTWLHNTPRLVPPSRRHALRVHPVDAEAAGLGGAVRCRVVSATGAVTVHLAITTDMAPGTAALPHGWGHRGGWRHANAAGGANSNELADPRVEALEAVAGMSVLNGIPIRLEPISSDDPSGRAQGDATRGEGG